MSANADTTRFSLTMRTKEKEEIVAYTNKSGVPRNELIRRAALAYVRLQEGKGEDINKLFQKVGHMDKADEEV